MIERFRVPPGRRVRLESWATRVKPSYRSKADYAAQLTAQVDELRKLQDMQYAQNRYAVLAIFQAMDAAGKDGAIKHVMSGVNPQGCQVVSFRHPSATELEHDFLWRAAQHLPERGRIGIFNRSYYEEVLIVRVHPEILRSEDLPDEAVQDGDVWEGRYQSIRDFERHLHASGTRVVKFFLHLSKEEQRRRFLARIDEADKNWKLGPADVAERKHWKRYMAAYEACLAATSTRHSPWYVVPADDKENARLIVSAVLLELFRSLKLHYPRATPARRRELQRLRRELARPGG